MSNGIRTDKLDTCAALLEDGIVGFFAGNSIQTTTHVSFAVMTIVRDLSRHYQNAGTGGLNFSTFSDRQEKDAPIKTVFQKSQFADRYNYSLIDRANFVKHAGKDPLASTIFVGNEDGLALSIALEDFGNFYLALKDKKMCCQVSELFDEPRIQEPKVLKLARLYYEYEQEYTQAREGFGKDYESTLIAMDELKRKYHDIVQQRDLAKGRSKNDQLVLYDSLDRSADPKPTAPA